MKAHTTLYLIGVLILIALLGSCAKEAVTEEPVAVRNYYKEAVDAHSEAEIARNEAKEEPSLEKLEDVLGKYQAALAMYKEAESTATEADSINVKLEIVLLDIANMNFDIADALSEDGQYMDELDHLNDALDIYLGLESPITITTAELSDAQIGAYFKIASAHIALSEYQMAEEAYDKILEIEPNNAMIILSKFTLVNDNMKDEVRALKILSDYAEASNDFEGYLMLANRYNEQGNIAEATKAYQKAMELNNSFDVLTKVSDFYRSNNKWADSNAILEKIIAQKPDNATTAAVYRIMGDNYDKLKNKTKKIEAWEKSVALERDAQISLAICMHYYEAKNYNKAITFATQVINTDSSIAAAYLVRGDSYWKQKKKAEAKADLERIKNDPQYGTTAQQILKTIK